MQVTLPQGGRTAPTHSSSGVLAGSPGRGVGGGGEGGDGGAAGDVGGAAPHPEPETGGPWSRLSMRPVPNLILRIIVLVAGFAFIALGVALSRATGMGTSPISCVPCVLSYMTSLTIGAWTFVFNTLLIVAQFAMLRRSFSPVQLLQLPCVFVFSALIDAFVPLAESIPMPVYPVNVLVMCVSVLCTAVGVFLEVKAALVPLPGEGVSTTASRVTGVEFPRCKLVFDVSNVVVGTVLSLAFLHGLFGVREGTILAALAVGPLVRALGRLFPDFERLVPTRAQGLFLTGQSV